MSLTRFLNWGSAALIGWKIFTFSPGEFSLALAQENVSCEQIVDKYEKKLEGGWFSKGCLDKFSPERSDKSDYADNFSCIKDFLEEYDKDKCGGNDLYNDSLEAMLGNLFVKDKTTRVWVREVLEEEGILDYQNQLETIARTARVVGEKSKLLERAYSGGNLSQRKALRRRLISWKNYLKDLRVAAVLVIEQALFLRDRPERYSLKGLDKEVREGVLMSRKTVNDLILLRGSLAGKNWYMSYHTFKEWKKDQKDVYGSLISVMEKGMDYGLFELGKGREWKRIYYLSKEGKWKATWASKEFAREWGENGKNFYGQIETIDKAIREVERINLRKRVGKKISSGTREEKIKRDYNPKKDYNPQERNPQGKKGETSLKTGSLETKIGCLPLKVREKNVSVVMTYFGLDPQRVVVQNKFPNENRLDFSTANPTKVYQQIERKLIQKFGEPSYRGSTRNYRWGPNYGKKDEHLATWKGRCSMVLEKWRASVSLEY